MVLFNAILYEVTYKITMSSKNIYNIFQSVVNVQFSVTKKALRLILCPLVISLQSVTQNINKVYYNVKLQYCI